MTRRDLLTLGLSVSVAGALGVASIRNAEAEEVTPGPGAGVAQDTPPVLPWGAKPQKIRTGKAGAASDTLHALGQVAAAADTSGATQPRGRYAPKGRSGSSVLRTEKTDIVPPQPAPNGDAVEPAPNGTTDKTVTYFYNYGQQISATDGIYANVMIAKPTLGSKDFHTLAELAAQSPDSKQIVEVGWTVDRVVNGDSDPHLFVYHWVNGVKTCYNGCGFVQVSDSVKPGDTLANGTTKRFGIQYEDGAWWIALDTEWIGYFPEKLWQDQGVASFDRAGLVQAFGEVAASSDKPCTQMGNGLPGTNASAAMVGSVSLVNGPTVAMAVKSTATSFYPVNPLSARTFQYGGPGAC